MCKYCEDKEKLISINEVSFLYINKNELIMFGGEWCGNQHIDEIKINFCPMCGEKLVDKS